MRVVDEQLVDNLIKQAKKSGRGRANYNFHKPEDQMQRMVNLMLRGTYVRPHKHENPDKVEYFVILEGKVACVLFDEAGEITEMVLMDGQGKVRAVEIAPRIYHSLIVLSSQALLMEFIEGTYNPQTHKRWASFAPEEGSDKGAEYLQLMMKRIDEAN